MNAFVRFLSLGLVVTLLCSVSFGALGRKNSLLGKFHASNVHGSVTCISDGRILELKKGDTILARGAVIDTAPGANATLVFSNGTGVYVDEKTRFTVKIFEQEFFAPNNNLRVEPSNSNTLVDLDQGRVVISTPRLLSGTTMVYETELAAVRIRGEKVMIETNEKQTHVAMIEGNASVNPRGPDGNFVSIGKRLVTGREAFVKFTLGGSSDEPAAAAGGATPSSAQAAGGLALGEAAVNGAAKGDAGIPGVPAHKPTTVSTTAMTKEVEAVVLKLTGFARAKLPAEADEKQIAEGAKLPKGTTLHTEDGSELYLQPFPGAIATIRPLSTVNIEKLSAVVDGGEVQKQTALLSLTAGTIVSTIDPAKRDINDYGIRTPKGIASAQGTSFSVSVEADGFSVATTADTVLFTLPSGDTYSIKAGNITISPVGGEPQAPVSLAQALSANPALAGVIQNAVTTVANIVQNNIGGLSADSATNLLTKVLNVATTALPGQATAFASQAVIAVTAPTSSTSANPALAASAVTAAIVSAVPAEAAQIAASAATSVPAQANVIAASAAKAAPTQAEQIAVAVTRTLVTGTVTAATIEAATQLAASVAAAVPNKAAPVAAAVMQALVQANPQATPLANAQTASVIASAVTSSAPDQAVEIAATMMKVLTQASPDATPQVIGQSAAMLAAAVTSVVPPQAQEVATAVMQMLVQLNPQISPDTALQTAGLIAAAVSQVAPDQTGAVNQAMATTLSQPLSSIQASAAQAAEQGASIAQAASAAAGQGSLASQTGNQSAGTASQGFQDSQAYTQSDPGNGGSSGAGGSGASETSSDGSTSIIITQFAPGQFDQLTPDIEAAQNAQSGIQFTPDPGGGTVNPPTPTIPPTNPIDYVSSPARNG